MRARSIAAAAGLAITISMPAHAQNRSESKLRLTATGDSTSSIEPGTTLTRVFSVLNLTGDTVVVVPKIDPPDGWSVVIGSLPLKLAPREQDTWLVSFAVPAQAPAGRHVVRISAGVGDSSLVVSDSILVNVSTRRALSLSLTDRPSYVVDGSPYTVSLLLRNRGNATATVRVRATSSRGGTATVRVRATSSRGGTATVQPGVVALEAGEARTLEVRVVAGDAGTVTADDVLEVSAIDENDHAIEATASARITVAREAGAGEPLATIPGQLRLRGARRDAGIAPFEITGHGPLHEGRPEQIDFTFRGSAGRASPFGEREEYRLDLRSPNYRARLGDNFFAISPLSGTGQSGFGGGLEARAGAMGAGGYSQRFRFQPEKSAESGGFLSYKPTLFSGSTIGINGVERSGGPVPGRILSSTGSLQPRDDMLIETEYAGSRGLLGKGSARSLRLSGGNSLHYDAGHIAGSASFAGPMRGAEDDYATISGRASADLELNASANYHRSGDIPDTMASRQRSRSGTLGASWANAFGLEYSTFARRNEFAGSRAEDSEHLLRARTAQSIRGGNFWANAEIGRSTSDTSQRSRVFHQVSLGTTLGSGNNTISAFAEVYDGGSVTRGAAATTLGGSTNFQILNGTTFWMNAYRVNRRGPGERGYSQLDGRLSQTLPTGATISLRARFAPLPGSVSGTERIVYVEYGMPLRIPVGRKNSPGTVTGRVVDAESGAGVSGALVRLGPAAAITDRDGRVSFIGLPVGEYRIAVAQHSSTSDAVFSGNPKIRIDSLHPRPAPFKLAVSRPASISGSIRRRIAAATSLTGGPDSLADGGALEGMSVVLMGVHDTIYRATDMEGKFSFADIPSGQWTVAILSEAPSEHHFDRNTASINLHSGETAAADFCLLPRKKQVQMLETEPVTLVPQPIQPHR